VIGEDTWRGCLRKLRNECLVDFWDLNREAKDVHDVGVEDGGVEAGTSIAVAGKPPGRISRSDDFGGAIVGFCRMRLGKGWLVNFWTVVA
jgi:hypothetical protein